MEGLMKKILYLHGFASSGASGTVELLSRNGFYAQLYNSQFAA